MSNYKKKSVKKTFFSVSAKVNITIKLFLLFLPGTQVPRYLEFLPLSKLHTNGAFISFFRNRCMFINYYYYYYKSFEHLGVGIQNDSPGISFFLNIENLIFGFFNIPTERPKFEFLRICKTSPSIINIKFNTIIYFLFQ